MVKNELAEDGICLDDICGKIPIMKSMLILHMVLKFDHESHMHIGVVKQEVRIKDYVMAAGLI